MTASEDNEAEIKRLFSSQPEDTQRAIVEVLKIEKEKIHHLRVIGAKEEIIGAIKDAVK